MPAIANKKENITPQQIRTTLGIDNREIVNLCRQANITPKKNAGGQIYFSKKEFETLKKYNQQSKQPKAVVVTKPQSSLSVDNQQMVIDSLLTRLDSIEKNLINTFTKTMDEKLDGMDEVVVELIRCKTENENLKQKINELNKENYYLKNSLNAYKPLALGLYVKREDDFIM